MKRIFAIVDDARPLSPCHDAFVIYQRLAERGHDAMTVELRDPAIRHDHGRRSTQSIIWPCRFSWSGWQRLRRMIQDAAPDEIHLWGNHFGWLSPALAGLIRCPIRHVAFRPPRHSRPVRFRYWPAAISRRIKRVSRCSGSGTGCLPWFRYPMNSSNEFKHSVRARLGVPEDARLVGTIGPFVHRSAFKDFMWAGDLLRCVRDDVYWLAMGSGPQEWRLKRFASQLEVADRLRLLDYRDDIKDIVSALDVYVQPSTFCDDYSGLRAAISARIPAVGISRSVHQQLISHHKTGYLIERGARNEIARCVNRLLTEPAVHQEFRAHIPAWSHRALCDVDEAIDRWLPDVGSSRARLAG